MSYELTQDVIDWLDAQVEECHRLLRQLCLIPAFSHHEDEKAAAVKAWLDAVGAEGVYIDEAKNVVFPINCEGRDDIVVFQAHTDTVFPMDTPLEFIDDGEKFHCPSVSDDTGNLVNMLMTVRYIVEHKVQPKCGILCVANACEEGLGNLKGTRQIFKDYEGRIKRFYTFDGGYGGCTTRSVGSHRYQVKVTTPGGHSWSRFGVTNAIVELAKLIEKLSHVQLPQKEDTRTTWNVGTIEGGTSVNTIAAGAEMLYEYRSNDAQCLAYMKDFFDRTVEEFRKTTDAEISVEVVGERPCGDVKDKAVHQEMIRRVQEVCIKQAGLQACPEFSGSTDANIPMSLGIPALCAGLLSGGGAHTVGEWVYKNSLPIGMRIGAEIILDYFEI